MEVIARSCYGIERAYERCAKAEHWKSSDPKVNRTDMYLLNKFDVVARLSGGYRDAAAERRAQRERAFESQMKKHLKGAEGGGPSGAF